MELRRLRYFAVLAEELHFTRAAARLHIAQPALSQQIRVLERELGAQLVDRRGGRCALTEVGRLVAAQAGALLAEVDATQERIAAVVRGQSGRLRVAYTRSARGGRVDALIARFRAENPQVVIEAETGWTAPNVAGLLADRFDVAFVRPPIPEPGLVCRWIDTEELLLALPDAHPLAGTGLIDRRLLIGEPAVMWPRDNGPGMFDRTVQQVWPDGGFTLTRHEPDDEQLLRAVAAGGVIAIVPAGRADALRLPGVQLRRFAGVRPTVDVGLAYRAAAVPPVVARLLAMLPEENELGRKLS
jgi:DNA-binding transcriptional LysR family regulator